MPLRDHLDLPPTAAPISVSIRPDSPIRLQLSQLVAVIGACLFAAFISGLAWAKISAHVDDPNHPTAADIRELRERLIALETRSGINPR